MVFKRLILGVVAASVLLAGCERPEDAFVGLYDGSMDVPQGLIEKKMDIASQLGGNPDEIEADMTVGAIVLELREDLSCTLTAESEKGTGTTHGTWSLNEEGTQISVKLSIGEASEENPDIITTGQDMVFDISDDGRTLKFEDEDMGYMYGMTFRRQ